MFSSYWGMYATSAMNNHNNCSVNFVWGDTGPGGLNTPVAATYAADLNSNTIQCSTPHADCMLIKNANVWQYQACIDKAYCLCECTSKWLPGLIKTWKINKILQATIACSQQLQRHHRRRQDQRQSVRVQHWPLCCHRRQWIWLQPTLLLISSTTINTRVHQLPLLLQLPQHQLYMKRAL